MLSKFGGVEKDINKKTHINRIQKKIKWHSHKSKAL